VSPASGTAAARQRELLFEATVELVARRGYLNTSLDQIVTAAGVGYGAFYDLYAGKEDCFLAAFDRIVEEAAAAVEIAAAGEEEWPRQVAAALALLLALAVAEPARARIALVEIQAAGPAAYTHFQAAVERALPKLREGRDFNPVTEGLSEALEDAILGGVVWIVHQRLVKGELKEVGSLLEETIQLTLAPYVGEAEARRVAAAVRRQRH
jgi:AcrR family transcriptional regulator